MKLYEINQQVEELTNAGNHAEVVLPLIPGQESIVPMIHPLIGRYLTRQEWQEVVNLVERWYDSLDDAEIVEYNRAWAAWKSQPTPPVAQKEHGRRRDGWIYVLKGDRYYKIGQAVCIDNRLKQIEPKMPFPTELVHSFEVDDMNITEKELHEHFADKRTNGEWFALTEDDVEWLRSR